MTNRIRLTIAAAGFAAAASMTGLARADDATMEPVWEHYWMAVAAANQCENYNFSSVQYDAMTHYIDQRVNYEVGAGPRTHLIDDAKDAVRDRAFKYGCNDQQIAGLLTVFHTELEPVIPR